MEIGFHNESEGFAKLKIDRRYLIRAVVIFQSHEFKLKYQSYWGTSIKFFVALPFTVINFYRFVVTATLDPCSYFMC